MIRIKQFRPFPRVELLAAVGNAKRVGVLDRNHSPGSGGIFWNEVATTLRDGKAIVQGYVVGLGGGDVTPTVIDEIVTEFSGRDKAGEPVWKEVAV
jgi:pyruvate/2-oxoacid:ferredoxin oxidoreductase alpha subunit